MENKIFSNTTMNETSIDFALDYDEQDEHILRNDFIAILEYLLKCYTINDELHNPNTELKTLKFIVNDINLMFTKLILQYLIEQNEHHEF